MDKISAVEGVVARRPVGPRESRADGRPIVRDRGDDARPTAVDRAADPEAAKELPEARASTAAAAAEARARIAAMLAEVDALRRKGGSGPAAVSAIPLSPTADRDAIAAAQMLAERIAADARHSLNAQARIGGEAVRSVIGRVSAAARSSR